MAREHMIVEQNAAYEESLQADREKMKKKEEQRRQEEEERQEKEAIRQSMASVVPLEPAPDCPEKTSTLRIRLPDGSPAQRRFLASNTVQVRGGLTSCCGIPDTIIVVSQPFLLPFYIGPTELHGIYELSCSRVQSAPLLSADRYESQLPMMS